MWLYFRNSHKKCGLSFETQQKLLQKQQKYDFTLEMLYIYIQRGLYFGNAMEAWLYFRITPLKCGSTLETHNRNVSLFQRHTKEMWLQKHIKEMWLQKQKRNVARLQKHIIEMLLYFRNPQQKCEFSLQMQLTLEM